MKTDLKQLVIDEFSGKNAKKNPDIIFSALGGKWVFSIEDYTHRYPTCWRCKTELVWRVVDEWYISMDKIRKFLKMDLVLMLAVLIYSIIIFFGSLSYDFTTGIFPRVIAAFLFIITGYMFIGKIVISPRADAPSAKQGKGLVKMPWYTSLVLMVAYFVLIVVIGLPAASAVYLFATIVLLGYQRKMLAGVYAVLFCGIIFGVFIYFLGVPMPRTVWDIFW